MLISSGLINLETFRGDDVILNFTIKEAVSNLPIDITDWIFFLTIKAKIVRTDTEELDDDAVLKKDVDIHVDPDQGLTQIVLTNEDTDPLFGEYQYDVQYKDADDMVNTVMRGIFTFNADITRRNTV
jgi:hypothetical protein